MSSTRGGTQSTPNGTKQSRFSCQSLLSLLVVFSVVNEFVGGKHSSKVRGASIFYPQPIWFLEEQILDFRDDVGLPLHEYYSITTETGYNFTILAQIKKVDSKDAAELANDELFSWKVSEKNYSDASGKRKRAAWLLVNNFSKMPSNMRGTYLSLCIVISFHFDTQPSAVFLHAQNLTEEVPCLKWRFKVVNSSAPFNDSERDLSRLLSTQTALQQSEISFCQSALQSMGSLQNRYTLNCSRSQTVGSGSGGDAEQPLLPVALPELYFESKTKNYMELFDVPRSASKTSKKINGYLVEFAQDTSLFKIYYLCPTTGHRVLKGLKVTRKCPEVLFAAVDEQRILFLCSSLTTLEAHLFKVQKVKDMLDYPDWVVNSETVSIEVAVNMCRYSTSGKFISCRKGSTLDKWSSNIVIFNMTLEPFQLEMAGSFSQIDVRQAYRNWTGADVEQKELYFNYASGTVKSGQLLVLNAFLFDSEEDQQIEIWLLYLNISKLSSGMLQITTLKRVPQAKASGKNTHRICELDQTTFLYNPVDGTLLADGANFNLAYFPNDTLTGVSFRDDACLEELGLYLIYGSNAPSSDPKTNLLIFDSKSIANAYKRVFLREVTGLLTDWMTTDIDYANNLLHIGLYSNNPNRQSDFTQMYVMDLNKRVPKLKLGQGVVGRFDCLLNETTFYPIKKAKDSDKVVSFSLEIRSADKLSYKQIDSLPVLDLRGNTRNMLDLESLFQIEGVFSETQLSYKSQKLRDYNLFILKPRASLRYLFQNERATSRYEDVELVGPNIMVGFQNSSVELLKRIQRSFVPDNEVVPQEELFGGTFTAYKSLPVDVSDYSRLRYKMVSNKIKLLSFFEVGKSTTYAVFHFVALDTVQPGSLTNCFILMTLAEDPITKEAVIHLHPDNGKPRIFSERIYLIRDMVSNFEFVVRSDTACCPGNTTVTVMRYAVCEDSKSFNVRLVMYTRNPTQDTWYNTLSQMTTIYQAQLGIKEPSFKIEDLQMYYSALSSGELSVLLVLNTEATLYFCSCQTNNASLVFVSMSILWKNLLPKRYSLMNCSIEHKVCIFLLDNGEVLTFELSNTVKEANSWEIKQSPAQRFALASPLPLNRLLIGKDHAVFYDSEKDAGVYLLKIKSTVPNPFWLDPTPHVAIPTDYLNGHLVKLVIDPDSQKLPANNSREVLIITAPSAVGKVFTFGPTRLVISPQQSVELTTSDMETLSLLVNSPQIMIPTSREQPSSQLAIPLSFRLRQAHRVDSQPSDRPWTSTDWMLVLAVCLLCVFAELFLLNSIWFAQRVRDITEE